jgi:uncharacterized protein YutD
MTKLTEGSKLYITANYAFDYNKGVVSHLYQLDIITQWFENKLNLKGFVSDEEGDRVEDESDVSNLMDALYEGFFRGDIPSVVIKYLLDYELYEILAEYHAPIVGEALKYKTELIKAKNL